MPGKKPLTIAQISIEFVILYSVRKCCTAIQIGLWRERLDLYFIIWMLFFFLSSLLYPMSERFRGQLFCSVWLIETMRHPDSCRKASNAKYERKYWQSIATFFNVKIQPFWTVGWLRLGRFFKDWLQVPEVQFWQRLIVNQRNCSPFPWSLNSFRPRVLCSSFQSCKYLFGIGKVCQKRS